MFGIEEDEDIMHLTRGDKAEFSVYYPIYVDDEVKNYVFKSGDRLSFIVKEKKGYTKEEVFRKDFIISEETPYPLITLTGEETKWGEIKNKKQVFWFDVVLNDDVTIMGFSEDGAAKIYLYPEAGEKGEEDSDE